MYDSIASLQNPKIKNVVRLLEKSSERRKQGIFVVEGVRETDMALKAGYEAKSLFFCPHTADNQTTTVLKQASPDVPVYEVTPEVFARMAYRETTGGIIGIFSIRENRLSDLNLSPTPLIIVLEAIEKPGNLGAILRTADAAQVDAIVVCDPTTDIFNPNVIRSSLGCVFSTQVAVCTTVEAISFFKQHHIQTFAAALTSSVCYAEADYTNATALVMGTEATGLSAQWLNAADQGIIIPMLGKHDSLNVSTATAILTFEAVRQRGFRRSAC